MKLNYDCFVDIELEVGDVEVTVSGDEQILRISTGLAAMALPLFFSHLISFYKYEESKVKLENYGNGDYYLFIRDSNHIRIENVRRRPGRREIYTFDFYKFVSAIDQGFKRYFRKMRADGLLPLQQEDDFHPLSKEVLEAYSNFSAILKKPN
ncbi:hypothetical protein J2S09_000480 [Bacillus fengqiuensis]|nr:hypothetical protein [Bacillus fengqiuensis]